ncbi:ABC transporter substrate-binding protein [Chitinimonas naiadis]
MLPALSRRLLTLCVLPSLLLAGCDVANQPYQEEHVSGNVLFSSFQERPKYLDPVSSYNLNETPWTYATYEPLLHYHYLKRPYTLEGLTAVDVPTARYLDKDGKALPDDAPTEQVATSVYTIKLKPGIRYQPHPAFAKDAGGKYLYQDLTPGQIDGKHSILDFPIEQAATSTREATADDYVYQIKRLASPWVATPSPIYNLLNQYIVGLKELGDRLKTEHDAAIKARNPRDLYLPWHDLRQEPLSGVRALDASTLEVRVIGKYPQIKYWMAMTFFVPIPWEADRFYAQRNMAENSLSLNSWPVGTGPFMLTEQDANRYVMKRNPNYRDVRYPAEGMPGDKERGWLADVGKRLPLVDELHFYLEKEREPEVSKLMQGYYDLPDLSRIDIAFALLNEQQDNTGRAALMREHGLQLIPTLEPTNWYVGFNMLDPVVGQGSSAEQQLRNRKLRQAISIAFEWEEFGPIFFDKMGPSEAAMGPVPPGLFGYRSGEAGINPVTHVWRDGRAVRRPLAEAQQLMVEAGYPGGRDAVTGKPLLLFLDSNGNGPNYQGEIDWRAKQLAKLGIQTEARGNDYNRFQDRMRKGNAQVYFWGWFSDYPDPENYLFLLTSSQGKVKFDGENASNYANPEYDQLYDQMKALPDGPERQKVIDRMIDIVRRDAPWSFGVFPGSVGIYQQWVRNAKPTAVIQDKAKYLRVDSELRAKKLVEWNQPKAWPLGVGLAMLALLLWPAWRLYRRRESASARVSRMAAVASKEVK